MTFAGRSRYEMVSRRSMLKASFGAGFVVAFPGLACGNNDRQILADAAASPTTTTTAPPTTTTTTSPLTTANADAVRGELVIEFTYTQAAGGKNERPYVAVWIENTDGDLVHTVALWYQLQRRGARWLDHLTRWYDVDLRAPEGIGSTDTVSSATRAPGSYAVVWDGTVGDQPAPAARYFVCIESAREEGPYSLIREPFTLTGSLAQSALPDDGELSAASARIDG